MKKEGTGEPQNPDISLDADVRMRELSFDRAPNPEVRFRGNTRRNSVWGSRRENLPDKVREGVLYRDAGVRLRIATEMVSADPGSWNRSDSEGVKIGSEYPNRTNGEQIPKGKEEKE
jgi:ssDNA-binding replication factor A large subunit